MRYAIISDVHANVPALEAVLETIDDDCQIVHLGDIVGYGPHPREVVEMLADIPGVRGNHDDAALGLLDLKDYNASAVASAYWTSAQLSDEHKAILARLPYQAVIDDPECPFTIAHGSPFEPEAFHYIQGNADAMRATKAFTTNVAFVGHTHQPESYGRPNGTGKIYWERHGFDKLAAWDTDELIVDTDIRYVVNPGSVGQPRDKNPHASYAIFDTHKRIVSWHRVAYDISRVSRDILAAGLPERNAARLVTGI